LEAHECRASKEEPSRSLSRSHGARFALRKEIRRLQRAARGLASGIGRQAGVARSTRHRSRSFLVPGDPTPSVVSAARNARTIRASTPVSLPGVRYKPVWRVFTIQHINCKVRSRSLPQCPTVPGVRQSASGQLGPCPATVAGEPVVNACGLGVEE
jgi:hypothetical protein